MIDLKNKQNRLLFILGILSSVILIAIIIITIINLAPKDDTPRTRIENWSEDLSHVPEDTRIRAEQKLYSQIEMNLSGNIPTSGAKIRKDSQTTVNIGESFTVGDFIVDIPQISQSYVIQYFYGQLENTDQEPEISVSVDTFCITNPDKKIYNFSCTDSYGAKDTDKQLSNTYLSFHLPHTETLADGTEFTINLQSTTEDQAKVIVLVNSCGDKTIMQKAGNATKEWLSNLSFNTGKITYSVPLQYINCLVKSPSNVGSPINTPTLDRNESLVLSINNTDRTVLSNLMGSYTAQKLFTLLEETVFNAVSTEGTSVSASILPSSLITIDKDSFSEHSMLIELSDGRTYFAEIANKKNKWCGIILSQVDSNDYPHLYTYSTTLTDYDTNITNILDWARELYPDGIIVTTNNLYF